MKANAEYKVSIAANFLPGLQGVADLTLVHYRQTLYWFSMSLQLIDRHDSEPMVQSVDRSQLADGLPRIQGVAGSRLVYNCTAHRVRFECHKFRRWKKLYELICLYLNMMRRLYEIRNVWFVGLLSIKRWLWVFWEILLCALFSFIVRRKHCKKWQKKWFSSCSF